MLGVPRSGTSWLQGMLAQLPEIATVRETHLVDRYLKPLVKAWKIEQQQPAPDGLKAIFTEAEFYDAVHNFGDRIFAKMLEFKPNAEIVLEKTPDNLNFVDLLNRLYPDAYFVHLIRDPRAVVASHLALKQEPWSWIQSQQDHIDLARKWVWGMKQRDLAADLLQSRFLEVRYEEMKQDQNAVLQSICNFLALNYSRQQLQELIPQVSAADLERTKADFPLHNPFFDTRTNFFRRGEIDSWKEELTTEQIIQVEAVCIRGMITHHYQPQYLELNL